MRLPRHGIRAGLVLTLYTLLTHGLLLLYDGVYSDGWLFYTYLSESRWDLLTDFFVKQGHPHTAYLYRLLALFPDFLLIHRLLAFAALLSVGWLLYGLTQQLGWFTRSESLLLGLWSVGFPAYQYGLEISHLWNLLPYPFFLAGWWLALRLVDQNNASFAAADTAKNRSWKYRLASLLCLTFSFMNPALLVFYGGFLLVWLGRVYHQHHSSLFHILRRYPDFFLLPPLYWGLMRLFFPPHGIFADYNEISLTNLLALNNWSQFVHLGVIAQLTRLYDLIPVFLFLLLIGLYLLLHRWRSWEQYPFFHQATRGRDWAIFLTSVFLLGLTAFPFVAVGKLPSLYGFDSRITLLIGLPVALLLLTGLRLLFGGEEGRMHRAGWLFALFLLVGFTLAHMESYFAWQARWVRDQSIKLNLADLPLSPEQSIIYMADEDVLYQRSGRVDAVSQAISRRYFQDWTVMLRQVYGPTPGRVGMDVGYLEPTHHYYRWLMSLRERTLHPSEDIFFLRQVDPAGHQAIITIQPTPYAQQMSKLGLARRYWQYRLWQPEELEPFLRTLTNLHLEPYTVPNAMYILPTPNESLPVGHTNSTP